MIIFTHVAKSAGSSVKVGIRDNFKSRTKYHTDWETEPVIEIIKQMNRYDLELYEYARDKWNPS